MDEKLYQNIDLSENNPLDVKEKDVDIPVKKPLNSKFILLIVLGSLIFVLLLISLIITQIRKNKSGSQSALPTSAPIIAQPTINDSLIPSPYQDTFKQLEQNFSQDPDLPVPQTFITIGQ